MKKGLLVNTREVVTCRAGDSQGDLSSIQRGAVAWDNGVIAWVGPESDVPDEYLQFERFDANNKLVVPGLVDCHTHLAFGGWRADEFGERARGVSYLDIAKRGGGILKTVEQTRRASEDKLLTHARKYMREMIQLGVTTIECKSGYGLSVADELKTLRVYDSLRREGPARIVSTCLGAHVVPAEFRSNRTEYVQLLCEILLPAVAANELASFCDIFVEEGAFTHDEARQILMVAKNLGMGAKLHVDQLGDSDGALLAASLGAVSADHLEYVSDQGIEAIGLAGVTPVTLPLATLYLRQQALDARRFLDRGIDVAVATDFNPGSAPSFHLPLAMTLASTMNRMTPAESLKGATLVAARAIDMEETVGSIEVGKRADLVLVDSPSVDHWIYQFAPNRVVATIIDGTPAWVSSSHLPKA